MTHISVDCYVRASALVGPTDSILSTLQGLHADGTVDELHVHAWPNSVVVSTLSNYTDVLETFRTFQAWSAIEDVSIEPPFSLETRTSEITGETREILITPVLCLSISVDDVLYEVVPHRADGETRTVNDVISGLLDGSLVETNPVQTPITDGGCPECAGEVDTGQGLYACRDCAWVGIATTHNRYRPVPVPFSVGTEDASSPVRDSSITPR